MVVSSSFVFEGIKRLKPDNILDVVPASAFRELGQEGYQHIGNGNAFEWKYAVAKYLQPKRILEIGVRYGYSFACFIMGSDDLEYAEGWDSELYVEGSNKIAVEAIRSLPKSLKTSVRKLDSSTVTALSDRYDLIHIDSSHNYEICLADIRKCAEMTKAILVDDTLTCRDDMQAVCDFCKDNERVKSLVHIPSHVGESLILLN